MFSDLRLYGNPAGRELWFFEYAPGSNVRANSFMDEGLTIPHPSPVVADANGIFPPIYLDGSKRVIARLFDKSGTLLMEHSDARQLCGPAVRCHECGALIRHGQPLT